VISVLAQEAQASQTFPAVDRSFEVMHRRRKQKLSAAGQADIRVADERMSAFSACSPKAVRQLTAPIATLGSHWPSISSWRSPGVQIRDSNANSPLDDRKPADGCLLSLALNQVERSTLPSGLR